MLGQILLAYLLPNVAVAFVTATLVDASSIGVITSVGKTCNSAQCYRTLNQVYQYVQTYFQQLNLYASFSFPNVCINLGGGADCVYHRVPDVHKSSKMNLKWGVCVAERIIESLY